MPRKLVSDELWSQIEPLLPKHKPRPKGRESIVESQRPAGKGQSGEHVKKQPLYRADMRSVLDSCFDIDPVEKRFDRLAYGTHIRRKGIVRGNLFVEQFLARRY